MDYRHEIVMPNNDLPFRIFKFEGMNGNYSVTKHWHHSVEIFAVKQGEIEFYINSKQINLSKGHALVVNSNQVHSIVAKNSNDIIVIQIPLKFFQNYSMDGYIFFDFNESNDGDIYKIIVEMYDKYLEKDYGYKELVSSMFYRMIYIMLTEHKIHNVESEAIAVSKNLNKLSGITEYIKDNYNEEISLSGVADKFGFSSTYLSRIFQKNAGVNFKTYVQNIRVNYACRELINTNHKIGDIALNNGFANIKSFTNEFKKRYGMVPSEYRKSL